MSHSFFHTAPPMLLFYSEDVRNARRRTIFFEAKATLLCVQRVDRRICPGGSPTIFVCSGNRKSAKPIACGKNNAYQLHRMRTGEVCRNPPIVENRHRSSAKVQ